MGQVYSVHTTYMNHPDKKVRHGLDYLAVFLQKFLKYAILLRGIQFTHVQRYLGSM
jgi:hypothetical protein